MAVPNVGQRETTNWVAVVGEKPEDGIHDDYWLMNRLQQGDGFKGLDGGDRIVVPIEYALNSNAGSYSDTDTVPIARVDVLDRSEAQWKEYAVSIVMSQIEEDRNSGQGQVFPLLPAKMENARNSLLSELNIDAHGDGTGNSGKDLTGLGALVSATPTTGTVQTMNRANFSFFRNQQQSGAQTSSAFDNLRSVMRSIYNLSSNGIGSLHPEFGVTTRTVFEGFEGLLIPNERFTDKSSGDGGFKNEVVKFKGMLLSYDNDAPSGTMRMLNTKFLKLCYKTGQWMKMRPKVNPANQTIDVILIRSCCQLVALNPRRLGVITAIT